MSDSDDTDVLLMIPPDLFLIPSSDSEDNLDSCSRGQRKTGVVSELIDHMQVLESRISAIESKDSPNNSLNLDRRMSLDSIMSCRQTSSKNKYSVSQNSSLQSSPSKPYCFSLPSTPNIHQKLNYTNENYHRPNFNGTHQIHKRDFGCLKKHDHSNSLSEPLQSQRALQTKSALHAGIQSPGKDLCLNSTGSYSADLIKDTNSPGVNKLLKDMQSNHNNKASRNQHSDGNSLKIDKCMLAEKKTLDMENRNNGTNRRTDQEQELATNSHNTCYEFTNSSSYGKKRDFNCSLPDSSFSSFDTERFMNEFKSWHPNYSQNADYSKISNINLRNFENSEKLINGKQMESSNRKMHSDELPKPETHSVSSNFALSGPLAETTDIGCSILNDGDYLQKHTSISDSNEMQASNKRPHRLLTLSDIWSQDSSKPEKERLQMKLDEEKFKREHCEQLIQELQKKLLEHQEKIAVAIRVDNEKNSFISQFQESWKEMQQKLYELEADRESFQKVLKEMSEKHQLQIVEYQKQIVNYKQELTDTRNLATGYKEKNDAFVQEKVNLLKNHTDELQNYKMLVQQAESRYEEMKIECQKLMDKNKKVDETMKCLQQDLNAELLKSSEIKAELSVIHKALDACEAELVILRQEKENLQLKLKEESNRNVILQQGKDSVVSALDEAKKLERLAMNEVKSLTEQQEKLRAELRDVYQKQVDQVVKTKLAEFQTQLDSAEAVFQNEVETKQRAIAECAARKIKSVMDKHQLEIHLVEEKHREEKKLFEIKLAQAVQKSNILEAQLNSYRKSKSQLVEQLYSMLQKQWHQALVIISGGNGENMSSFQKISVDKLFDFSHEENLASIPEHVSRLCTDPIKAGEQKNINVKSLQVQDIQNDSLVTLTSNDDTPLSSRKESKSDLRKYIKMILDMQQKDDYQKSKVVNDNAVSSRKEEVLKQSLGKNSSAATEGNWKWQAISEVSIHDTSEYLSPPQKFTLKSDQPNEKPPWK